MKKLGILYIALTSVFLFSCNDETKVKSYSPTTFYSFNTPEISFGDDADKVKKFKLNFTFQCDTSNIELIGLPDKFWTVEGNKLVLDLTKASVEWAGQKLEWQLKFKEAAEEGDYKLKLSKVEATMGGKPVDMEFTFADGSKRAEYSMPSTPFSQNIKFHIPTPLWLILVIILGVFALVLFGLYKYLTRPTVFGSRESFVNSSVGRNVRLKGLQEYDLEKEGWVGAKLTPQKKSLRGRKIIAIKLSPNMDGVEKISLSNGTHEEKVFGSITVKNMDKVTVTRSDGGELVLEFRNSDQRNLF